MTYRDETIGEVMASSDETINEMMAGNGEVIDEVMTSNEEVIAVSTSNTVITGTYTDGDTDEVFGVDEAVSGTSVNETVNNFSMNEVVNASMFDGNGTTVNNINTNYNIGKLKKNQQIKQMKQ